MEQQIQFTTTSDKVNICYATIGQGPPLVKAANWLSHLEFDWRSPLWRHWWDELAKHHFLVRYDERGCGLSDWDVEDLSFDAWVNDLESVVDVLGLDRFALLGISQGGAVAIEYAVRHPERVSHLLLYGCYARGRAKRRRQPLSLEEIEALVTLMHQGWGKDNPSYRQIFTSQFLPDGSLEQMQWFNELQRVSASPENAARLFVELANIDVEDRLAHVGVPTLVLHARDDMMIPFEDSRQLAAMIPNAKLVPLEGRNHLLLEDEPAWPKFLSEVRGFLGTAEEHPSSSEGIADVVELERPDLGTHTAPDGTVTIMFSDVEESTAMTERLGDRRMQEILLAHNTIIREQVALFGGFEVKSLGDGFMLAFSGAMRALECAISIQRSFADYNDEHKGEPLGVRIGLHTGEVLRDSGDFFGIDVILASRITGQATGGEILVSSLLKELTDRGGDIQFGEAQEVELKGLAEINRVYSVAWD